MASSGVGSMGHLTGELFKITAGVDFVHVPYRGAGPALTDLLAGQVATSFAGIAGSIEYIRTGRLRALAVSTAVRVEALSDVPTVSEFLPGFEADDCWRCAPKTRLPTSLSAQLGDRRRAGRSNNQGAFRVLGCRVFALSPDEFGKLLPTKRRSGASGFGRQHQVGIDIGAAHLICSRPEPLQDFQGVITKFPRRDFLSLCLGAGAFSPASRIAMAETILRRPCQTARAAAGGAACHLCSWPDLRRAGRSDHRTREDAFDRHHRLRRGVRDEKPVRICREIALPPQARRPSSVPSGGRQRNSPPSRMLPHSVTSTSTTPTSGASPFIPATTSQHVSQSPKPSTRVPAI